MHVTMRNYALSTRQVKIEKARRAQLQASLYNSVGEGRHGERGR